MPVPFCVASVGERQATAHCGHLRSAIGIDFEVLDPPDFVERVKDLAGRFARAAG
jgi:hypothetical protein